MLMLTGSAPRDSTRAPVKEHGGSSDTVQLGIIWGETMAYPPRSHSRDPSVNTVTVSGPEAQAGRGGGGPMSLMRGRASSSRRGQYRRTTAPSVWLGLIFRSPSYQAGGSDALPARSCHGSMAPSLITSASSKCPLASKW